MERWYKLDNAGKLFPAVTDDSCTSTYRISVMLTELIQPEILQQAVDTVLKRFPTMTVKLNNGVYWDYFSENKERLLIRPEQDYPCAPIYTEQNNGHILRILYYRKKISVEAFRALTDGTGIMELVKTRIYQYLILTGKKIDDEGLILLPEGIPNSLETEDSFGKYYQLGKAIREKQPMAFHIPGDTIIPYGNNVIHGTLSATALRDIAKQNDATITAYLTAVMNINMQVSPDKTFDDIVCEVAKQMKVKNTKEYLYGEVFANIKFEKIIALRLVSRFIKKAAIKYGHNLWGETKTTTVNGKVKMQIYGN